MGILVIDHNTADASPFLCPGVVDLEHADLGDSRIPCSEQELVRVMRE